uniref:V-set and transmembrane domain-containing protein 2-like protein n=1 Tax=Cyanistes caeruleus TaxID=156563 RepID=A0A8C0U5K8_CYACU
FNTPHDMTAQAGEDVEMACSFRGSGSPSYSLEIQWWYVRNHKDWTDKQTWASSQVMPLILLHSSRERQSPSGRATKISVVKVVGSNISHKLRLSRVKLEDEGTYECRVIDSSDGKARHHKVKAYLRVEAAGGPGHPQDTELREAPLAELASPGSAHPGSLEGCQISSLVGGEGPQSRVLAAPGAWLCLSSGRTTRSTGNAQPSPAAWSPAATLQLACYFLDLHHAHPLLC